VALAPKISYLPAEYAIGAAAVLFGTVAEASPIPVDDNLSIPILIGGAMWLMYVAFLPTVDIFSLDRLV
jgi:dolichol kinase